MVHAYITFCMLLNPTMCYPPIELVPTDHRIASIMECAMGGMMIASQFTYEGVEWISKGVHCREDPSEVKAWIAEEQDRVR